MLRLIDFAMIAARRPDLVESTLQSFSDNLLRHFSIGQAVFNIDPIWGNEDDGARCRDTIKRYFPQATIFEPSTASFGAAVKRVWSATSAPHVFSLEDDWLLMESVGPEILNRFTDPAVKQIALNSVEKGWPPRMGDHHWKRVKPRLFGLKLPLTFRRPAFTTSPSFIDGPFIRKWAKLIIEDKDPEKQISPHGNPELDQLLRPWKVFVARGLSADALIRDTGREWREQRQIVKKVRDGVSTWYDATRGADQIDA